ncbi:uncharacterized protein LOC144067504 [Stigmatopora argus]
MCMPIAAKPRDVIYTAWQHGHCSKQDRWKERRQRRRSRLTPERGAPISPPRRRPDTTITILLRPLHPPILPGEGTSLIPPRHVCLPKMRFVTPYLSPLHLHQSSHQKALAG